MRKIINETLISEMKIVEKKGNNKSTALCILEGPCMEYGSVNRNNRIYSEKLVRNRILDNPDVKEALKNKSMLGEGCHPEERVEISYPDVALCVEDLWLEPKKQQLFGRFAILDTPNGRILETLVKYGSKIGISARALTESEEKDGHEVISETTYDLITFDAVPDPGFKCARLAKVESTMKALDAMSINELKTAKNTLISKKIPAFESRIQMINKEIERRDSINLPTLVADLNSVLKQIRGSMNLEKYEDVERLIDETRTALNELYSERDSIRRIKEQYNTESELLNKENEALRKRLSSLEDKLYTNSLSSDYIYDMRRLNQVANKIESILKNKKKDLKTESSKRNTERKKCFYNREVENFNRETEYILNNKAKTSTEKDLSKDDLQLERLLKRR